MGPPVIILIFAIILPSVLPLPCDQQVESTTYQSMIDCVQNPSASGDWHWTNMDPLDCAGFCINSTITAPTPAPCDQQYDTSYYYEIHLCRERRGIWVNTNMDPLNCQGYCKTKVLTIFDCPNPEIVLQKSECENSANPGVWIMPNINLFYCQGYCQYPCNQQNEYMDMMTNCINNSEHPGEWITTNLDPLNCQGFCNLPVETTETSTTSGTTVISDSQTTQKIKKKVKCVPIAN